MFIKIKYANNYIIFIKKYIFGGDADFKFSEITDLGKLQNIGGSAVFYYSRIRNLGKLQSIGGNADFYKSEIINLGQLQNVGGNIYIRESALTEKDFENIKVVGKISA